MIDALKRLPDTLQSLSGSIFELVQRLDALLRQWDEMGGVEGRIEALELSRAKWEAEVEALALQAESRFKQARAAEERARGMEQRAEKLREAISGDEEGMEGLPPEYLDLISGRDGDEGEEEGVQPMHQGMDGAPTGKERAKAMKWGR